MKDVYVEKFSAVLDDIYEFRAHPEIKTYASVLLADHVEKTDFFTEPFGLRYMDLRTSTNAKELGDNCLVIAGVFPEYGQSRGLTVEYFSQIGIGSYDTAATVTGSEIFALLAERFDHFRFGLQQIRPRQYF